MLVPKGYAAKRVATALFVIGASLTIASCDPAPTRPEQPKLTGPAVLLVSPARNGRFRQNDPDIGCTLNANRGYGLRVAFDWEEVEGATSYQVVFWATGAQFPAIVGETSESEYEETWCNSFVIDRNLDHWIWKVAAIGAIEIPTDTGFVVRDTVLWSEEREFGFEPCRLSDGRACNAPALP